MKALEAGADVLDIGAESSRPFSDPISAEEEWSRLGEPLQLLKNELGAETFSKQVSIDTYKPETAAKVLDMGVSFINDIGGGRENKMLQLVASYEASIVLMHALGPPKTMQENPSYADVTAEVLQFLEEATRRALSAGISDDKIIWDYGIGFGKRLEDNLTLLKESRRFRQNGRKLMAGISKKSFIGAMLGLEDIEARKDPTLILHTYLALQGVDILRVHDIQETEYIRQILHFLQ